MKILVLNCGSSSVKFRVFRADGDAIEGLAVGAVERLGSEKSLIALDSAGREALRLTGDVPNHQKAVELMLHQLLPDPAHGCIGALGEIEAIGHRVVHGGERFNAAALITEDVKQAIHECARFAPLHNPANLNGVYACERVLPDIPQVAVFDTAFHSTLPPDAYLYAIPIRFYRNEGIRRYGFHGASHTYVAERAALMLRDLGRPHAPCRVITCHLGNGASIAAVRDGVCMDTSMGFTPLEGLAMGTRCGDLDPAIVLHLQQEYGPRRLERMFNSESGLRGLTGYSDMRDVLAMAAGNRPPGDSTAWEGSGPSEEQRETARVALRLYARRVKKYIGAFAAVLGGADAVVFTAGVGENSPEIRAMILEELGGLGIHLHPEANRDNRPVISTEDSPVAVFVIPTNEELVIARETRRVVRGEEA